MSKAAGKRIRRLHWQGVLTVQEVSGCRDQLQQAMAVADKVVLRLDEVEEIDIAFMQLLCAAYRTAAALDKEIEVSEPLSPNHLETVRVAGFFRHTGCSRECRGNCIWSGLSGG